MAEKPKKKSSTKRPAVRRLPSKEPVTVTNIRIPAWVTEEPDHTESYHLIAEKPDAWDQSVELTRSEYLSLKDRLAVMRGYAVPEVTHAN